MIVVSDASPLLALSGVGRLDILRELFGVVVIPAAIAREVAASLILPTWIDQRELHDRAKVRP